MQPGGQRLHALDALRAFAVLLGVGLHAAVPWVPYLNSPEGDSLLWLGVEVVHGFRMPLFFLLSGFFAALLWQRRGLASLAWHRARRIALPLALSVVTIIPLGILAIVWAATIAGVDEEQPSLPDALAAKVALWLGEPTLAHLWFLWVLLLLLGGFVLLAATLPRLLRARPASARLVPLVMWALPVATVVPQLAMSQGSLGPDTPEWFLVPPHILGYYATFFGFGALLYGRLGRTGQPVVATLGRRWRLLLAAALLLVFPAAFVLAEVSWPLSGVFQVAYAWLMTFGLIGLFQRVLSRERFWVRYLSDAAYWMYLVHLPLVFALQGVASQFTAPNLVLFATVTAATTAVSLASYHVLVRYTAVGTLLNGPRSRERDRAARQLATGT